MVPARAHPNHRFESALERLLNLDADFNTFGGLGDATLRFADLNNRISDHGTRSIVLTTIIEAFKG
jgi:hypothetical protein